MLNKTRLRSCKQQTSSIVPNICKYILVTILLYHTIPAYSIPKTRFVSKEENADDTMLISYDIKKKSKEGMLALNTTYHLKSDFDKLPEYTWTHFETKGEKPPPLSRHSAVVYGRRMIIFGGCYLDMQCFNHIYYLNLESLFWRKVETIGPKPSPREGHSACLVGNRMYVFGGVNSLSYMNDVSYLNLQNWTWEVISGLEFEPIGRAFHGMIYDNKGRLVVTGGYTEKGYSNDVFIFDILKEKWFHPSIIGKGPFPMEEFMFEYHKGRGIVFGGFGEEYSSNRTYVLDIEEEKWVGMEATGSIPTPRESPAGTTHGSYAFITGGCNYKSRLCYSDFHILNLENMYWRKLLPKTHAPLPSVGGSTMVPRGPFLYLFGGCKFMDNCVDDLYILRTVNPCPGKCGKGVNGICEEGRCKCFEGYFGDGCQYLNYCPFNCNYKGLCLNDFHCKCDVGWGGTYCQVEDLGDEDSGVTHHVGDIQNNVEYECQGDNCYTSRSVEVEMDKVNGELEGGEKAILDHLQEVKTSTRASLESGDDNILVSVIDNSKLSMEQYKKQQAKILEAESKDLSQADGNYIVVINKTKKKAPIKKKTDGDAKAVGVVINKGHLEPPEKKLASKERSKMSKECKSNGIFFQKKCFCKSNYVGSTCENEADTSTRYLIGEQIGMVLIMFVAGIVAAILYLKYFKKKSARNEEEFLTPDQFGS